MEDKHEKAIDGSETLAGRVRAFLSAIDDGRTNVAQRLLAEDPALPDASVLVAASIGDADRVQQALDRDPGTLHATEGDRPWTPIMYACWSRFHLAGQSFAAGSLRTVRLLLDRGADVNTFVLSDPSDPKTRLPILYFACESNNPPVVQLLLERGANPNDAESVYHSAQHAHLECLELLLAHGADLSSRHPAWNNTPLYFLAGHTDDKDGTAGWLKGMTWLLEHGADPSVTSYDAAETPLHALVRSERTVTAAATLLAHGARVDVTRADGRTPYALAVRRGNREAADLLRSHGATDAALSLTDRFLGACMTADDAQARAMTAAHPNLMDQLTDDDLGIVAVAAENDNVAALKVMRAAGFSLSIEGPEGGTPLHRAAWLGRVASVRLLLEAGAPIDVRDRTFGSSPIGWAAHGSTNARHADEDYLQVVRLLADAGASVEASINKWGEPPAPMASPAVSALLEARGFGKH